MGYRSRLLFALGLCCWASPAAAQDAVAAASIASDAGGVNPESAQTAEPASLPAQQSGWQFSAGPYLLMAGLKGEVGVSSAVEPVNVDLSFWRHP